MEQIPNLKIIKKINYTMSIKNIRLEVMQLLEKNVSSYVDQYLIPVEKIWQPSDFLPNSESDNFLEEVKELREISKDPMGANMKTARIFAVPRIGLNEAKDNEDAYCQRPYRFISFLHLPHKASEKIKKYLLEDLQKPMTMDDYKLYYSGKEC